jgi:hypothetical protein
MNCLNCNTKDVEKFMGLVDGKTMPDTLANFCRVCGFDLRPLHDEILKNSPIKLNRVFPKHEA